MRQIPMENYLTQMARAEELRVFMIEEFIAVMRERGHSVSVIGDEILLESV